MGHATRLVRIAWIALSCLALAQAPASASTRPKPDAPCPFTEGPPTLQTQWEQFGGARTFGCYERTLSDGTYAFRSGRMAMLDWGYGTNSNFEAYVDPEQRIHVSWATPGQPFGSWIVRLSADGSLVNQQTYSPGDHPSGGEVEDSYATGVIVHPGGRHGAIEVSVEGCFTFGGLHRSSCTGFRTMTFEL